MDAWRNAPGAEPGGSPQPGIVHRAGSADAFAFGRMPSGERLVPYVDHLWWVAWDLTGLPPVPSQVLPFPSLHLTVEDGRPERVRHGHRLPAVLLHGVPTRDFTIELSGTGWVAGVRFRPGGWSAFAGGDAAALTDRVVVADGPLGAVGRRAQGQDDLQGCLETLRDGLAVLAPPPDPAYVRLCRLIDTMAAEPTLRVTDLPELSGWSQRTLQRRFREQVGVSPKWVLQRYRLIQAAFALERDPDASLATVSAEHGWYDQAHFTNEFRDTVGTTPGAYASRVAVPAGTSRMQVSASARPSPRRRASRG